MAGQIQGEVAGASVRVPPSRVTSVTPPMKSALPVPMMCLRASSGRRTMSLESRPSTARFTPS